MKDKVRKIFLVLCLSAVAVYAQLDRELICSYSGAPAEHNIQLFDYDNDGNDDYVISYTRTGIWKVEVHDQSGNILYSKIDSLGINSLGSTYKFGKVQLFYHNSEKYLGVALSGAEIREIENNGYYRNGSKLKIYKLNGFELISEYFTWTLPDYPEILQVEIMDLEVEETNEETVKLFMGLNVTYQTDGSDLAGIPSITYIEPRLHIYEFQDSLTYVNRIDSVNTINLENNICYGDEVISVFNQENLSSQEIFYNDNPVNVFVDNPGVNNVYFRCCEADYVGPYYLKSLSIQTQNDNWVKDYEEGLGYNCGSMLIDNSKNEYLIYYGKRVIGSLPTVLRKEMYIRNATNGEFVEHDTTSDYMPEKIITGADSSTYEINYNNDTKQWDIYKLSYIASNNSIELNDNHCETDNFRLNQNYPNPFNPTTQIQFQIMNLIADEVTVSIYNLLGQQVKMISSYISQTGNHSIIWDGKDSKGKALSAGTYYYTINYGDIQKTGKMCLLK